MDLKNGVVGFVGKKAKIYQNLKKSDFKVSDLYADVLKEDNDIYSNYYLKPQLIGKMQFIVRVYFNPQNIVCYVNMSITKDGKIPTWDNWSEQDQLNKKDEHNKWLKNHLGNPPYKYLWGEITSNYDPRSGSSMITIRYDV